STVPRPLPSTTLFRSSRDGDEAARFVHGEQPEVAYAGQMPQAVLLQRGRARARFLPIDRPDAGGADVRRRRAVVSIDRRMEAARSEEHTSELQSRENL